MTDAPHHGQVRPCVAVAVACRRLRGRTPAIVAFTLAIALLNAALLAPAAAAAMRFFLQRWGRASVGNFELAQFLLSPEGIVCLVLMGGLAMSTLHLELGGLAYLLDRPARRSWHALALLVRRGPALVRLGLLQFILLLLAACPALLALAILYRVLWAGHDLNGLIVLKPPVFWIGLVAAAVVVALYAATAFALLVRWAMAPMLIALDGVNWATAALRQSAVLTRGRRVAIARAVAAWAALCVAVALVGLVALQWFSAAILDRADSSIGLTLAATATVLTLDAIAVVAWSAFSRAALMGLLLDLRPVPGHAAALPDVPAPLNRRLVVLAALLALVLVGGATAHALLADLHLDERIEITAHRAGAAAAPENTLAALHRAIADRADWVEIDVQLTADGRVVVIHDTDLWRVAGVRQRIDALTLAQVQAIDIGSRVGPEFAGQTVPTLDQMLVAAADRIRFNIELKPARPGDIDPLVRRTLASVAAAGLTDRTRICSQSYPSLMLVRQLEPRIPIGFIAGAALGDPARLDVDFLMVSRRMASRQLISAATARNIQVHAWTINNADHLPALLDRGVANIITDHPAAMRARLDELRTLPAPQRLLLRAGHALTW